MQVFHIVQYSLHENVFITALFGVNNTAVKITLSFFVTQNSLYETKGSSSTVKLQQYQIMAVEKLQKATYGFYNHTYTH